MFMCSWTQRQPFLLGYTLFLPYRPMYLTKRHRKSCDYLLHGGHFSLVSSKSLSFDTLFLQPETVTVDFGLVPVPWEKQHPDLGLLLAKEMLSLVGKPFSRRSHFILIHFSHPQPQMKGWLNHPPSTHHECIVLGCPPHVGHSGTSTPGKSLSSEHLTFN